MFAITFSRIGNLEYSVINVLQARKTGILKNSENSAPAPTQATALLHSIWLRFYRFFFDLLTKKQTQLTTVISAIKIQALTDLT